MTYRTSLQAAAMLAVLAGCSGEAGALPPLPDQDNRPALQAAIDRLSAAGGGVLQLERGVYGVAMPLYLRDGVTVAGRGPDTVITNQGLNARPQWFGTTMFAGNLTVGSFSDDMGEGYPARPVRKTGDRAVELADCSPADLPRRGQVVWLSSQDEMRGKGDRRRPVYGEMTLAAEVDGCRVSLADPIRIPSDLFFIHWGDGSRKLPGGDEPNAAIKNAGVRDLAIASAEGNALDVSGCYRCTFTGLNIGRTRRLISGQGQRHTRYGNISGSFRERGIEVVMFARDVTVEDVDAELRDPYPQGVRPAIRFGEYARGNVLRNIRLRLGSAYVGRPKIRFDESAGNRLEDVELSVARRDRMPAYTYLPPGSARALHEALPPDTTLTDVRICYGGTGDCVAVR